MCDVVWCSVLVGCVVGVCPWVLFLFIVLVLKTTLPCVPSKRLCDTRHGRFDGTHGIFLKGHTGASRADCLSVSLFPSLTFSCRLSPSLFNDDDNDRSSSWLSL